MTDAISHTPTDSLRCEKEVLLRTRALNHPNCHLCGTHAELGLGLQFEPVSKNQVTCSFNCARTFQGYPQMLHGGITSALLDAAMTNCLFSFGIVAVTAELTIRYVHPVLTDCTAELLATLESPDAPLYLLKAQMTQQNRVVARAKAKFFRIGESVMTPR